MARTPREYLEALALARALGDSLDYRAAEELRAALERYALDLRRGLEDLPPDAAVASARSAEIVQRAAARLGDAVEAAVARGVRLSFTDTLRVWREAQAEVAASAAVVPNASMGAVQSGRLTIAQTYEALRPEETWRTLARDHVANAAAETHALVRDGLLAGKHPEELATALEKYVLDEPTPAQARAMGLDPANLPPEVRGSARLMEHNARRIAFSETHTARKEAEVLHFQQDPHIALARWTLSPNRGKVRLPCVCDALAKLDWYGLGVAIFPLEKVPATPHPWDRCEVMPVVLTPEEAAALPRGPYTLKLNPWAAPIPGIHVHTARGQLRLRQRLAELLKA